MSLDTTLLEIRERQAQLAEQIDRTAQLGGGGGGGGMDQRLGRLEAQFDRLDGKVDRLSERVGEMDVRLTGKIGEVDVRLGDRIGGLAKEMAELSERVSHLPTKEWMLRALMAALAAIAAMTAFADKIRGLVS